MKERRVGAVASPPYREGPWGGWMLLCFFLRAEEMKKEKILGKRPFYKKRGSTNATPILFIIVLLY